MPSLAVVQPNSPFEAITFCYHVKYGLSYDQLGDQGMNEVWAIVHQERQALINDLEQITPEQWNTQSLCEEWSIHDLLAHLVDDAKTSRKNFLFGLIRSGFNMDRLSAIGVNKEKRESPEETLDAFKAVRERTTNAPAPLASRLVEIIVHGEDARRPLGIPHEYPMPAIIAGIEYQLSTSDAVGGSKGRASGLHLVASDTDWSHGAGALVRGEAIDLLLALTGRHLPFDALTGDGASILRGRRY